MLFTVQGDGVSLGVVDLPTGLLVAGRLNPSPEYAAVAEIVRDATDAFLRLGLFGSAASINVDMIRWRRAAARAAEIRMALIAPEGDERPTHFVNLLESPTDHGVVVIASFHCHSEGAERPGNLPSFPRGLVRDPDGRWATA